MKKLFTGLLLAVLGLGTLQAQSLRDSLLYNYKMNGDLSDETGNGPIGAINGSTLTTDRFGNANAALLINTGGVPTIAHDASNLKMNGAFTISLWISPTSVTGVEKVMLAKLNGGDRKLVLRLQGDGKTHSHFNSGGLKFCTSDNSIIGTNSWQHVVYTWDGNIMSHYVNGQLIKSCDHTGESINFNAGQWVIGNLTATGNEKFSGSIDDLRMYNRTLASTEVENLYNIENQADAEFLTLSDSLMIHLPLNNDFNDLSGNGHHGINVNTTPAIDRFDNANGAKSFAGGLSGGKRVTIPHSPDFLKLANGFTMTTWAKRTGGGGVFLAKLNNSDRKN